MTDSWVIRGSRLEPAREIDRRTRTVLDFVHPETACAGESCVIHHPSAHHMLEWNLNWRDDIAVMERLCPHGIGHPDPDDITYHKSQGETWQAVHGCDGCCAP